MSIRITRRKLWVPCVALAGAADPGLLPEQDIRTLLSKMGDAYAGLAQRGFVSVRFSSVRASDVGSLVVQESAVTARDGDLWRHERNSGGRLFVFVVGKDNCWEYQSMRGEYIERPATHPRASFFRETARYWLQRTGERFHLLPKILSLVEFQGWQRVKTKAGEHRCAVINIRPSDSDAWIDRLWIDPDTALVWKSVMNTKAAEVAGSTYVATTTTTLWDRTIIGEPPSPENFVFKPPRRTRRVESFRPIQLPG